MLSPLRSLTLGLCLLAPLAAELRAQGQAQSVAEPRLRVLLQEAPGLTVRAPASGGLRLRDRQGRVLQELGADQVLRLRLNGGWVEADPEPLAAAGGADAPPITAGVELWIEPVAPAGGEPSLWLQQRRYRGQIQILPRAERLQAVNHVPLESYLPSVVGSEMPASWPIEALRAQAVAARTYALKGRKPAAPFDLKATVASQVYKGVEAETPSTRAAVAGTRGLVLTHGNVLIDAVFHSSSGGSTESSGDLWPSQLPYLVSVPDFDDDAPVRQWRQPLDAALLAKAFAEIGGVQSIQVLSTTPTGRVRQARVVGPSGQLLLSGAQLRSRLGLKSTWVRFEQEPLPGAEVMAQGLEGSGGLQVPPPPPLLAPSPPAMQLVAVGRGYGHGIGMSQWGAYAMALRGDTYGQILQHYYRGTQVRSYAELALAGLPQPGSWSGGSMALASGSQPLSSRP